MGRRGGAVRGRGSSRGGLWAGVSPGGGRRWCRSGGTIFGGLRLVGGSPRVGWTLRGGLGCGRLCREGLRPRGGLRDGWEVGHGGG